jgi:hypothetical protein
VEGRGKEERGARRGGRRGRIGRGREGGGGQTRERSIEVQTFLNHREVASGYFPKATTVLGELAPWSGSSFEKCPPFPGGMLQPHLPQPGTFSRNQLVLHNFLTPPLGLPCTYPQTWRRLWGMGIRWTLYHPLAGSQDMGVGPTLAEENQLRASSTGRKHLRILHLLFVSWAKVTLVPQIYSHPCLSKAKE